ncbi:MAG: hypothetical protein ACREBS_08470 [Nitrososphaerales archaeon]
MTQMYQAQQKSPPGITVRANLWIVVPIGALIAAVATHNLVALNYVHVFTAILWTGTDIFMGFVLGPILRNVSMATRKDIISWLMPKMIFYMTTVSSVTTTAGYFLASQMGLFTFTPPLGYWIVGIVVIVVIMLIQGLGLILPINLKVYFELRKSEPDYARISRLMRMYVMIVASQAVMQFAVIFLMAHLATGTMTIF